MVQGRLDPYCPPGLRFLGIVDTNALLSSVANDCGKGALVRSRLLRMADAGTAVLYAADHVYAEAYEHLPKVARWTKVPVPVMRARFEEHYLPALRFVTVDASQADDPQVLAITDPDDVPTGQLAKLIAPCVVFSEDRHLRRPGFAPPDWQATARCAIDIMEGASGQRATTTAVSLPFRGTAGLIGLLGRQTGIPPWLLWLAAAGGTVYVLRKPVRREAAGRAGSHRPGTRAIAAAGGARAGWPARGHPPAPRGAVRQPAGGYHPRARTRATTGAGDPGAHARPLRRPAHPDRLRGTGRAHCVQRVRSARAIPVVIRPGSRTPQGLN